MKILHITQYFHPERGYQENQVAKLQVNDGHEVAIITSNNLDFWGVKKEDIKEKDLVFIQANNVEVIRLDVKRKISSRLWLKDFTASIENFNPDLLILHTIPIPTTLTAMKWGVRHDKKIIADSHMVGAGSAYSKGSKYFYNVFRHLFPIYFKLNRLRVDKWIGVSKETIKFMEDNYSIKDNIHLVPLGFDDEFVYKDIEGGRRWRENNGIPKNKKIILYIGKVNFEKDPIQLIEAFNKLHQNNNNYILVFVGDHNVNYKEKLESLVKELQLQEVVFFLNSVLNTEIRKVFSIAEVVVWPHASSMAMLEAMACECPVVASRMPVNEERLGQGRGGLFVENDIEDMAVCIKKTITNKIDITSKAKGWINKYTWKNLYKEFYI